MFTSSLQAAIKIRIQEAAEPEIQAALKKIEGKMREAVAEVAVTVLRRVSIETYGHDLLIKVSTENLKL